MNYLIVQYNVLVKIWENIIFSPAMFYKRWILTYRNFLYKINQSSFTNYANSLKTNKHKKTVIRQIFPYYVIYRYADMLFNKFHKKTCINFLITFIMNVCLKEIYPSANLNKQEHLYSTCYWKSLNIKKMPQWYSLYLEIYI
jgi:hypothetical protein